jgi:hypothetical protein
MCVHAEDSSLQADPWKPTPVRLLTPGRPLEDSSLQANPGKTPPSRPTPGRLLPPGQPLEDSMLTILNQSTYLIFHISLSMFFSWEEDWATDHKNIREFLGQIPTIDLKEIPKSRIVIQMLRENVG